MNIELKQMEPVLLSSVVIICKDYSFLLKGFLECIILIILLYTPI